MENNNDINKEELINNIIESLKSKINTNYSDSNSIMEVNNIQKINDKENLDINKILNMIKNSGLNNINKDINNNFQSNAPDQSGYNLDASSILNLQRMFAAFNKADPRKNLLSSLKPFLRQTRQKSLDTYINIINVISMLGSFSDKGQ